MGPAHPGHQGSAKHSSACSQAPDDKSQNSGEVGDALRARESWSREARLLLLLRRMRKDGDRRATIVGVLGVGVVLGFW